MPVDSGRSHRPDGSFRLQLRLLGSPSLVRDGVPLPLPPSRKVRALLAYLTLAPQAVTRSRLCELLWEAPNDPRGELRWCLSKVRSLVDEAGRRRVQAADDSVRLDLADCFVDAVEVARAARVGIRALDPEWTRSLAALFAGDLLEGLEIERSPVFGSWLVAQRRRFRDWHAALLEHLVGSLPDEEALVHLEKWLQLTPFDRRVHQLLLAAFARCGRFREAEEHLAAATRLFEAEGLDAAPLRVLWRSLKSERQQASSGRIAVSTLEAAVPKTGGEEPAAGATRRASVAVMPFVERDATVHVRGGPGDGLAYDVITRLAKLRSLFVIAQGSVFALHERGLGAEEAGRTLKVDYVVGGSLRRYGGRLGVSVELCETATARVVWSEVFDQKLDDAFLVLDEIGDRIVASIASEIETIERNRAVLKPPNSLDAWEAHHRGLWHMYRFNRADNELARHFFEMALRLDPTFSRAYAGLSFTHFQNAFQGWAERGPESDRAFEAAGQGLMADDRDPAVHWAMGRALWLRGYRDQSVLELEMAIDLSPNFALGHYTLGFVQSQAGDASAAIRASDHSRQLSPFDPMLFGMLGARAMALVRLGRFDEAADWGMKAAARPNAFPHIHAIAAYSLALAGRFEEARAHLAVIRRTHPGYGVDDFLTAMQFDPEGAALFREGAKRIGRG